MRSVPLSHLFDAARAALLAGGAVLRSGFAVKRRVRYKTPTSPVTQVDLASEKAIFSVIRRRFPDHTFLAEESAYLRRGDLGASRPGRYRWIIDPLDGTVNFVHGVPQSCVSVAVECDGRVLAGGVFDPYRRELFMAARGKGATLNGKRVEVSDRGRMRHAMVITGFPYDRRRHSGTLASLVERLLARGIDIRRFGAAALDLAWVACGRADAYWEFKLSPWDVAAGWLLVEEAGGRVSDLKGRGLTLDNPLQTLATNGRVHDELIRIFRPCRAKIEGIK